MFLAPIFLSSADSLLLYVGLIAIVVAIVLDRVRPVSLITRIGLGCLGVAAIVNVLMRMHVNQTPSPRACFPSLLLLSALGFGLGCMMSLGIGDHAGLYWSRFGWDISVVLRARFFTPRPKEYFPALPGAIFVGLLLSSASFFDGDCPELLTRHWAVSAGLILGLISAGAWILMAVVFKDKTDAQGTADIEEFLSDPEAPVPASVPSLEHPPMWLKLWNRLNLVGFFVLISVIVLLTLAKPSGENGLSGK